MPSARLPAQTPSKQPGIASDTSALLGNLRSQEGSDGTRPSHPRPEPDGRGKGRFWTREGQALGSDPSHQAPQTPSFHSCKQAELSWVRGVGAQVQRPSSPVRRWNTLEPGRPRAGPGCCLLRQRARGWSRPAGPRCPDRPREDGTGQQAQSWRGSGAETSLWSHSEPLEQLGPFPQRFEAPGGAFHP